jgi:hypothetical protein
MLSAIPYIGVVFKALATAFKVAERILKVTARRSSLSRRRPSSPSTSST